MKNEYIFGCYQLVLGLVFALGAFAEEVGDQIIDGIGETALVTRYVFRGDERDAHVRLVDGNAGRGAV